MKKTFWIALAIIVIAGGAWFFMTKPAAAPAMPETAAGTAPVASAEADDLNAIDATDADFTSIDADVNAL